MIKFKDVTEKVKAVSGYETGNEHDTLDGTDGKTELVLYVIREVFVSCLICPSAFYLVEDKAELKCVLVEIVQHRFRLIQ